MSHRHLRRMIVSVVLLALLMVPAAASAAAAPAPGSASAAREGLGAAFSTLWRHLANLWSEVGCSVDPYGGCVGGQGAPPPTNPQWTDVGCSLDPNGACGGGPSQSGDEGCSVDPYGGCRHGS